MRKSLFSEQGFEQEETEGTEKRLAVFDCLLSLFSQFPSVKSFGCGLTAALCRCGLASDASISLDGVRVESAVLAVEFADWGEFSESAGRCWADNGR